MNAFRAHLGGINETGASGGYPWNVNSYSMLQLAVKEFDPLNRLDANGIWHPVAAGEPAALVYIAAHVWVGNALPPGDGSPAQYVVKVIKNAYPGYDIATGVANIGTFPNTVECIVPGALDIANPGDHYSLWLFASNGAAYIDGNKTHSWWSGMVFP